MGGPGQCIVAVQTDVGKGPNFESSEIAARKCLEGLAIEIAVVCTLPDRLRELLDAETKH